MGIKFSNTFLGLQSAARHAAADTGDVCQSTSERIQSNLIGLFGVLLALCWSSVSWGQVAYYSFDYSTRDLSDNGNTALRRTGQFAFACGELAADPVCPQWSSDRHGADLYALDFNRTQDQQQQYVSIPDLGLSGDFSVAAWVRFESPGRSFERIVDLGQGQQTHNIVLARFDTSNDLIFVIYEGSTAIESCVASNVIVGGQWAHFAATWRSGDQRIYKNGVEVAACTAVGEPAKVPRPNSYVGRSNWASDAYFRGKIDHLWIDDRALTAAEIAALAESGVLRSQGVAAYYAFDAEPYDGSGNERTAQRVGSAGYGFDHRGNSPKALSLNSPALGNAPHMVTPDLQLSGSVSIAGWVRMTAVRNWGRIVDIGGEGPADNIILSRSFSTSDLMLEVYNGGASLGQCVATGVIPDNIGNPNISSWTHFAATWADGRQRIYKDGQLVRSCSFAGSARNVARANSFIGRSNFPGDENFRGFIDELWIYDREITADEVTALAAIPAAPCLDDEFDDGPVPDEVTDDACFGKTLDFGSYRRQLCDADWMTLGRFFPAQGARVRVRTSDLAQGTDTAIAVHRECRATAIDFDDNSGPGSASQVIIVGDETTQAFDLKITQTLENYAASGAYTVTAEPLFSAVFRDGMENINANLLEFRGVDYVYPMGTGSPVSTVAFQWLNGRSGNDSQRNFFVGINSGQLTLGFFGGNPNMEGGVSSAGVFQVLQPGATVGPSSTFSSSGDASLWRAGASGYIGFRTLNPSTGQLNYGYAKFTTTASSGFPATLHSWVLDTSGAAIVISRD
jgi:hypothetical protein